MNKSKVTRPIVLAFIGVMLVFSVTATIVFAVSGGPWYKNGATMAGSHSTTWINPSSRSMSSYSTATTPRGVIQQLVADAYLLDRCRNQNGTWDIWKQYGFDVKSASWSYNSGTTYAQGGYQNCVYGHEYRNLSHHTFIDSGFGLAEYYTLESP